MKFADIEEFQVIGVAARTTNAREMTGDGVIPKMWAKPPQLPDSAIIALYTDYESDEHGEYTFVLGSKAAAANEIPDGKVLKTVPAGRYAVFTSDRGPVQRIVVETWQRIWSDLQSRSFVADFEVHDQRAADPTNAVVDIYVGVK
jgi:predicted transcriptional regulator YdeE